MKSGRIARIAGINIYIHWTFALLIIWILSSYLLSGDGVETAVQGTLLILAIFGCVLLHELGHALMARRFSVQTRDITLYPIGGVARLERIPERPSEELMVALAGPAVNFGIAVVLFLVIGANMQLENLIQFEFAESSFLVKLLQVNLILAVFNLLPAFPMDGGRALRALLAMKMDYVRATQYAATTGQILAIGFGILGLFYNWFLLFIALFVFIGAQHEAHFVKVRAILRGVPIRNAMVTQFESLSPSTILSEAARILLAGEQKEFPVTDGEKLLGLITRDDIIRGLSAGKESITVVEAMNSDHQTVEDSEMLDTVFQRMQEAQCKALPVTRNNRLVGLITLENIGEWMMIQNSRKQAASRSHHGGIFE